MTTWLIFVGVGTFMMLYAAHKQNQWAAVMAGAGLFIAWLVTYANFAWWDIATEKPYYPNYDAYSDVSHEHLWMQPMQPQVVPADVIQNGHTTGAAY